MTALVGNTQLSNLLVPQADTITVNYTTPVANPNASVRVYGGINVPYHHLDHYIATTSITNTSGTATLQKNGVNFTEGEFVIAFDCGTDTASIGATQQLLFGQPAQNQSTNIYVLAQQGHSLNVHYSTPHGNTPQTNQDWIVLMPGQGPQPGNASDRISYTWVPTNDSTANVQVPINPPTVQTGDWYTVEYNPGHHVPGISAFYSFQFEA